MLRVIYLLVGFVILTCASASASVTPTETARLDQGAALEFHVTISYSGADARAEREAADTDNSSSIDPEEAIAYEQNQSDLRLDHGSSNLRWDGVRPVWSEVSATAQRFDGANFNAGFTLSLDGMLSLISAAGPGHTLTISNLSVFSSYNFSFSVPAPWCIVAVQGVSLTLLSTASVAGYVDPEGLAVVDVAETAAGPAPNWEALNATYIAQMAGVNATFVAQMAALNATFLEQLAQANASLFTVLAAHDADLLGLMAQQNASLLAAMAASDATLAARVAAANASLMAALAAQDAHLTESLAAQNATLLASLAAQDEWLLQRLLHANASLLEHLAGLNATLSAELAASDGRLWKALNESKAAQQADLAAQQSEIAAQQSQLDAAQAGLDQANADLARARGEAAAANRMALVAAILAACGLAVGGFAIYAARRDLRRWGSLVGRAEPAMIDDAYDDSPAPGGSYRGRSSTAEGEIGAGSHDDP